MTDSNAKRIAELTPDQRSQLIRRLRRGPRSVIGIPRQPRLGSAFRLSYSQRQLWFLDQLDPGNPTYNVPVAVRLEGNLDESALHDSLNDVVERHEVLRTTFDLDGDEPVQRVAERLRVELPVTDLRQLEPKARESQVREFCREHARHRFDLRAAPLLSAALLRTGDEERVLALNTHHIICDGWSVGIFVRELSTFYEARLMRSQPELSPLPIQYADYAVWQADLMRTEQVQNQLEYWQRRLKNAPFELRLPTDHPRPAEPRFRGETVSWELPRAATSALLGVAQRHDVTLFMLLLAGFTSLLYRVSQQADLVVGTPQAGRSHPDLVGLIGFFVNTAMIRADHRGNPRFSDHLARIKQLALEAYQNQDVPLERVVDAVRPARSASGCPTFRVMFTFLNEPTRKEIRIDRFRWSVVDFDRGLANRDLTLRLEQTDRSIVGHFEYDCELFKAQTIRRIADSYESLLEQVAADPTVRLDDIVIATHRRRPNNAAPPGPSDQSRRQSLRARLGKKTATTNHQGGELLKFEPLQSGRSLPLLVRPNHPDIDVIGWLRGHRDMVDSRVRKYGGLLFRGFPLESSEYFESFCAAARYDLVEYHECSTPRTHVSGKVYTSTEYPSSEAIMPHNELSYSHRWPTKIWFYCVTPADSGGATPLADSRHVYRLLDAALRNRFAEKKIMYVRNYGPEIDLPWQEVFRTSQRHEVEEYCRRFNIACEWRDSQRLRTCQVRQAVVDHPQTGETVWFNAAHMFHVDAHQDGVRASLLSLFSEDELPRHAYLGDGSPIRADEIHQIQNAYRQASLTFDWEAGDVLMLDNMLVAHGREPFQGPRRVLVSMAEPFEALV